MSIQCMKETTGPDVAPERSLADSATKLQQASAEMALNLDDLSESLSAVADGFAHVSETTNDPARSPESAKIDPSTTHSSGFGAADD